MKIIAAIIVCCCMVAGTVFAGDKYIVEQFFKRGNTSGQPDAIIMVKECVPSPTLTPSATPLPTATPTPVPAATPTPTPTPKPGFPFNK